MAPAELAVDASRPLPETPDKAKRYQRTKLTTGIASAVLSFVVLLSLLVSGVTRELAAWAYSKSADAYVALLLFACMLGLVQFLVTFPFRYYSGYHLEHRYGLSNQHLSRWVWEFGKGVLVGLPFAILVLLMLYYCLVNYGMLWWLPVSIGLTLLSVVLARLAPVIILPLFYKLIPLDDGAVKERILSLCALHKVPVEGIFSFNLSKNTKKANAAFTGIGKAKRIILGDTLLKEFTDDEIETVFAHELGHYTHHHIRSGIVTGILSTFGGLYITAQLYEWSAGKFGFASITDLAALPLLALWLSVFGLVTSPLGNALSRRHERQADRYAVETTGKREAFVTALRKLAAMNLSDIEPHPLVEILFYSHPSVAKRIRMVEAMGS